MKITLKDGSVLEFQDGITALDIASKLSGKLKKAALAAKVNGKVCDLTLPITEDSSVEILTFEDEEGKATLRHSASHVMAQAVKRLFPGTKLAIGRASCRKALYNASNKRGVFYYQSFLCFFIARVCRSYKLKRLLVSQ